MTKHKAGFVNIIGRPNAGKSTLMNALVGEKISVITAKAQTTRHRIMGIVNGDDFQIVYSDTPGVLTPNYKLHEKMMGFVFTALEDADIILLVIDIEDEKPFDPKIFEQIEKTEVPLLVLINKIDISNQEQLDRNVIYWKAKLPKAQILPISAVKKFNLDKLVTSIVELLPYNEPYYDKSELTDKTQRFFVSEIIRGNILKYYAQEIPYCCEVRIESFKEEETITKISALILVERDSQKGIMIGPQGKSMKRLGTQSRLEMEAFLEKKVFLELFVKVDKDWRNNEGKLKHFGYE